MGKKIAVLKTDFENCKQLYVVYTDIAKTYNEISKGDYVSKLVEEERRKYFTYCKYHLLFRDFLNIKKPIETTKNKKIPMVKGLL